MHAASPSPGTSTSGRSTRRGFLRWGLAGVGAVVVGGGAGVGAELLSRRDRSGPHAGHPPSALTDAIAAERGLIADLDATTGGTPPVRRVIRQARANHAAHLSALQALLATYPRPTSSSSSPARGPHGTPRTRAQLRAAERAASNAAAARAARLTGTDAALLACVAACEATHAELLG